MSANPKRSAEIPELGLERPRQGWPTRERFRFKGAKRCARCDELKPLEDFHHEARSVDGRHSYCKTCRREAR